MAGGRHLAITRARQQIVRFSQNFDSNHRRLLRIANFGNSKWADDRHLEIIKLPYFDEI